MGRVLPSARPQSAVPGPHALPPGSAFLPSTWSFSACGVQAAPSNPRRWLTAVHNRHERHRSLGDERVSGLQFCKAGEITVSGPELSDTVVQADGRDARIMNPPSHDPGLCAQAFKLVEIAGTLVKQTTSMETGTSEGTCAPSDARGLRLPLQSPGGYQAAPPVSRFQRQAAAARSAKLRSRNAKNSVCPPWPKP